MHNTKEDSKFRFTRCCTRPNCQLKIPGHDWFFFLSSDFSPHRRRKEREVSWWMTLLLTTLNNFHVSIKKSLTESLINYGYSSSRRTPLKQRLPVKWDKWLFFSPLRKTLTQKTARDRRRYFWMLGPIFVTKIAFSGFCCQIRFWKRRERWEEKEKCHLGIEKFMANWNQTSAQTRILNLTWVWSWEDVADSARSLIWWLFKTDSFLSESLKSNKTGS